MSIQSEITRLESAKAAIKAAIEGKGVTVPDATLLDGMAALIESIEAGGIDFTPFSAIFVGSYTPSENEKTIILSDITGNTDDVRVFAIGISSLNGISKDANTINCGMRISIWNSIQRISYSTSSTSNTYPSRVGSNFSFGSYYLKAGITYKYLIAQ